MAKNKSGTMSRMRTIGILLVSVLLVSVCAAEILAQAEPAGALLALEAGSLNTGSSEAPGSDAGNPEAGSSGTGSAESGSIETGSSEVEGTEPGQSEAGDVPDGAKQGGTGSDSVKVDVEPGTGDGMQPGAAGGTEPGDGADAEPGEGVGTESGTEPGVEAGAEPGAEGNTQPGTEPAEDSGGNPETEPVAEQLGITAEGNRYEGSLMGVITGTSTNKHLKALYAWITLDGEIFVAFAFYNNNVFNKNIENLRYDGVILFPNLERESPEQGTDYWYETELVVNNVALTRPDWAVCWLVVNYGRQTFKDPMTLGLDYEEDGFSVEKLEAEITDYTVTYDPNVLPGEEVEGTVTDTNNPYEEGETVNVMENAFVRAGYHFTGWNTEAHGTGTAYSPGATFIMPDHDVVLYAQWAAVGTLTVTAKDQTKTYGETFIFGGTEFTVTGLEGGDDVTSVTLTSEGAALDAGVGTYDIVIGNAQGTGLENYAINYVNGTLTVTEAVTMTVSAENVERIYDGNSYGVTATSNVEDATIKYLDESTGVYDLDTSPAIANVSDSPLTVKFQASHPNYKTVTGQAAVTINPKAVTITVDNASKVYGEDDPAFTGTVSELVAEGDLGEVTYSRTGSDENVGTYTGVLTATYSDNTNYTVTLNKGSLTITAAIGEELDITGYTGVYDGASHSITVGKLITGDTVYYSLTSNETDWAATKPMFTDVTAVATVYVKVENPNYNDRIGSGTVTINPKAVTITVDNASKVYGEDDPAFTGTVSELVAEGDLGEVTYSRTGSDENVGTYTGVLTATYTDNTNYTVTLNKGNFTITAATGEELDITGYTGVYDGASHSITVGKLITGDTVYYSTDGGATWSEDNPAYTNVGEYTVNVKVTNPNYNDRTGSGRVTITARPIEITAASDSKTYDGTALTNSGYSLTGGTLAEGDEIVRVTVTGSQTAVGSSANVASLAVIVQGGEIEVEVTDNYDITYVDGKLTVTREPYEPIDDPEIPLTPVLNKEDHFAYICGYPDNTVRPEGNITREEVAAVFFRLLEANYLDSIRATVSRFPDVHADRWSSKHIATLAVGAILEGYPDGTFRPGNYITRAELATIAARFDELSFLETNVFPDVEGHWAEKYINSAAKKGWVEGYPDGTFKPDQYITRAEFVTLVNRVLERRVRAENILPEARQFPDLKSGKWYYEAMQEAINSHLFEREPDGYETWLEITDPGLEW